jgi:hypothetical protein
MRGAILPLPQYAFVAWCLVKHRDNFTFCFIRHTAVTNIEGFLKIRKLDASFEAFTALKAKVVVFRVMAPCNVVARYQRFGELCCLHLQGDLEDEGVTTQKKWT